MSWNPCSRRAAAALLVLLALAAVGVAGAVTVAEEDVPEEAEVNSSVTASVVLEDLYANETTWELRGSTSMRNPDWTVELYQGDTVYDTASPDGRSFELGPFEQGGADSPTRIRVEVTGTVPVVDEYTYEEPETFRSLDLRQLTDGGTAFSLIGQWDTHHYTQASREARQAIDDAQETIDAERESGTDVSTAEETLDDAIAVYDRGDLDDVPELAEQASTEAQEGGSTDGTGDGTDGSGTGDGTDGTDTGDSTDGTDTGDDSGGSGTDGGTQESGGSGTGESGSDDDSGSSGSDDDGGGGFLSILLGLIVFGLLIGGGFWYYQQQQGPSRDPLG